MCVVANACATSTGLYDPIDAMGDFCIENDLWFHVDGAHGAAALADVKICEGIEKARSLIWDAHKMMRVQHFARHFVKDFKDQAAAFQQKDLSSRHRSGGNGFYALYH